MKTRTVILIVSLFIALFVSGCTLTTTLVVEEDHDIRLVNRSGQRVWVQWADDSYRYLDDGQVIYVPANSGCYELKWEEVPSKRYTRPSQVHVFQIEISADIDIVFREGPDIIVIDR